MCGFIAASSTDVDVLDLIEEMDYRGLAGYKGFRKYGDIQMAHYSLPFVNLDPNVAIQPNQRGMPGLFVGEVFNYKSLGDYKTDTQAVQDAFWNFESIDNFMNFDGFWTYVSVYNDRLIGITDHLGIKPLYYRNDMDAMASEPNVLLAFGPVTRNELFHSNVMKWGYDPTGGTPWNEIGQVPPGHYVYAGQVHKYWDWNRISFTDLRTDLKHSVELRLGGQRDIAILLSGGLDSTIIYGLVKELGRKVVAIHVDNGEQDYAKLVANNLVEVKLDAINDDTAVRIHQSPVDLGSVKPQIAMARKLADLGFHAVLTGDGADELFGGYRRAKKYDSQWSDVFMELPYYHLPKLDRTMMRSTVELRAPFLAPKVIKYALNLPYNMRNGEKKVLKNIFEDLVPASILARDKMPLKTDAIRNDPMKQRIVNEQIWRELYE